MGRKTPATAAGRTDTGVHALGQGVSFAAGERWGPMDLLRALNGLLPREIWVQQVHLMKPGFDARRSAMARRYRYLIGTDDAAVSPFRRPYEWALGQALDVSALQGAAAELVGEHSFRGLAAAAANTTHYRCRVALAQWAPRADGVGMAFTVEADRFLHHMVRFLVGTMVDIALGRRPPADFPRLLAGGWSGVGRSRGRGHRRDGQGRHAAREDRREHRGEDSDDRGGHDCGAPARGRRDSHERHAVLLERAVPDRGKGGCVVREPVHRPAR